MKKTIKFIGFVAIEFVILVVVYIGLLTVANVHTTEKAKKNMIDGLFVIDEVEGDYPKLFDDEAVRFDNYTDRIMIQKSMLENEKPFICAIYMGGYQRYWHGYVTVLKPLFSFLSLYQIRKVFSLVLFGLAALCALFLYKKGGMAPSLAFILMWAEYYSHSVAGSFQYFWCYIAICASVLSVCLIDDKKKERLLPFLFFGIGSVVNYLDLLTFPLATLTVPLLVLLFGLKGRSAGYVLKKGFLYSLMWGCGYSLTWAAKWGIARIFLGKEVTSDVSQSILFRLFGNEQYPLDRMLVLKANVQHPYILHHIWFVLGALILSVIAYLIFAKGKRKELLYLLGLLPVLVFPYIWYELLCNHSLIHHFFTYRAQMGTSFGIYCIIFLLWKGIYEGCRKRQKKIK